MDGSCTMQIFPSRKFNALAHIINTTIYSDIIYPFQHTQTHHGLPRFVEMPVEKGKLGQTEINEANLTQQTYLCIYIYSTWSHPLYEVVQIQVQ